MPWTIAFHDAALAEANALSADIRARLNRMILLIAEYGLEALPPKAAKPMGGGLWELRIKGKDGIARAFYVARSNQRLIIVRVFVKKTQKTPLHEIKLAQKRAGEV